MTTIKNKLIASFILLLTITFTLSFTSVNADELTGRSLEKEMREMIAKDILSGYEDGTFKPEENVTRAQFAAFIARALELPEANGSFKDVPASLKLATTIYKVNGAGLMNGYDDNTFKPNELITREQVAITMKNVMDYSEMATVEKRIDFTDKLDFVSSGGLRAVFYSINYNIISGFPNNVKDPNTTFRFAPRSNATREQAAAFISRFLSAKENYNDPITPPEKPVEPEIPVDQTLYQLASIQNGKLVKDSKTYKEYLGAAEIFNSSTKYDAMYRGNELVRVKTGIAFGDNKTATGGQEVTVIYLDENFKKQATYIEQGREMRYLGSNDKFVKVQVGATIGYVKHSQVDLIPLALVTKRDNYTVSQYGTLFHNIYNYVSKSSGSYTIGPAPNFLKHGTIYHSPDGVHFMNETGAGVGTYFPYFQFLSARTQTSYTAEELDNYILAKIKEREALNLTRYRDASTKSKLIGMGQQFKTLENDKRINALFILSLAIHESDYGMSPTAQECNNLFGLYKYDSLTKLCPDLGTFTSPELSAIALVDNFLNPNYLNPLSGLGRNLGAAFGNKTTGFNVNYASDPTWGAKAGAHMYENDKAMGGKDLHAHKQFAITKYDIPTRVRTSPDASSSANILFEYKARYVGVYKDYEPGVGYPLGYPLVIIETVTGADGFKWYKVLSDLQSAEYGYIREDVVNVITYP